MDGAVIRQVLLTIIHQDTRSSLQSGGVLRQAAKELNILANEKMQQALLTVFYDLFRSGHLAWGIDIGNVSPPFFHVTEQGRKALQYLSRDPMNPDGYIAHLSTRVSLSAIPSSYIIEALNTYNATCYKATAVMVGCAAEKVILELRDTLVNRMAALGHHPSSELKGWKISKVLSSISNILNSKRSSVPQSLQETYDAYWTAFTGQIRISRNDVGHPASIDPVTQETVHSSLLIFPALAQLASDLEDWINTSYA